MFRALFSTGSVGAVIRRPGLLRAQQLAALAPLALRMNSSISGTEPTQAGGRAADLPEVASLQEEAAAEISPEAEAKEWLDAVRHLRSSIKSGTVADLPDSVLDEVINPKFEPTIEQRAHAESLKDQPIPARFDPVVEHCTNIIMKDGKKLLARKRFARALYIVKLHTRRDPVEVLKETLDKLAPLMTMKTYKTRTAKNLVVPVPLNKRQRDRRAFFWILEGSTKRRSRNMSVRLAEEIIAAYEDRSSGFDKRTQIHKTAMLHRAYIKLK